MSPQLAVQLLNDTVPLPFLKDTIRLLFNASQTAYGECRSLAYEVAHDHRGDRRRALFEGQWPGVARQYRDDGVWAEYRSNRPGTAYYTEVCCGKIILTASC